MVVVVVVVEEWTQQQQQHYHHHHSRGRHYHLHHHHVQGKADDALPSLTQPREHTHSWAIVHPSHAPLWLDSQNHA